ncbi:MAG: efflux RND transporter periplasmic adaptor subunit [Gammaproteobacteria bacterium]|nr:efflux RND transporter periplasmic adaptor subunit [Gammaproteobacteria bacterium]
MTGRALMAVCLGLAAMTLARPVDAVNDVVKAGAAVREVRLSGFTRPRARLQVITEEAGRVLEVPWEVGEAVAAEGVFARLDTTFLALELEANEVEQARLRARIDYDLKETQRQRVLAERGDSSRAALDAAEQALRDGRYALQALEVAARVLEERLRRTRIHAPAGWRVSRRQVEPGQWVNVGDPLGEVVDLSLLVVPYALTAEQFNALKVRPDGLRLELPELAETVAAEVHRVSPHFDPTTRKIPVELALRLEPEQARGGWRALLTLELAAEPGTVQVSRRVLRGSYEEHWLVREGGERVPVTVLRGLDADSVTVNAPGLAPGDRFRVRPRD